MTAQVLTHPSAGAIADETVRRAIKALLNGRGVKTEDLARGIGMTPSTLYRRLAGKGSTQAFTAGEVAVVSSYFGVPVGDLYSGLGGAVAAADGDVPASAQAGSRRSRSVELNTRCCSDSLVEPTRRYLRVIA